MPFPTKAIRDQARKRIAVQVRSGQPCALCGSPIDLTLRYPHPQSFTVDHIIASSHGGTDHYEQWQPSHSACNKERGNLPDGSVGTNSGILER